MSAYTDYYGTFLTSVYLGEWKITFELIRSKARMIIATGNIRQYQWHIDSKHSELCILNAVFNLCF